MHVVRNSVYLFLGALLLFSSAGLAADFKIGPDTTLDSLAIAAAPAPPGGSYLVAWRDLSAGATKPRMTGVFVNTTGIMTAAFPISDAAGQPLLSPVQRTILAFDAINFLMVWSDNRAGGSGIRGALVSQQGTVVGGADFLIAPLAAIGNNNPQVVFDGLSYFVAWQDAPQGSTSGSQIYFARVSLTGVPGTPVALPIVKGSASAGQSLEFLDNGPANEVLIVFQDLAAVPPAAFGARVAADNTLAGNGETLLFKRDIVSQGFGAPIAATFDGTQYNILSSYGAQIDSTVFQTRFLPSDGSVIRPSAGFAEVAQGATGLPEDNLPRAVFNGSECLFLRNIKVSGISYHIFIDRVQTDGTNRDLNPVPIDSAAQGILNGAVAAPVGTQYLIVWADGRRLSAQPAGQANVYGVLFDDTQAGDTSLPFLKAVARAGPLNGVAPLKVQCFADGSTGLFDSLTWDFGDGSTDTVVDPVHTYNANGDYIAVLSLFKAGYAMHDFVHIVVGGLLLGGSGGPAQSVAGAPGPLSAGVNPNLLLNELVVALDFAKPATDALTLTGFFDPAVLPVSLNATTATITVGSKTYTAGFDSSGRPVSPSNIRFSINTFSGSFSLITTADELQSVLAPFGAISETDTKPGKTVVIPVTISYATTTFHASVTGAYTAQAGKSGKYEYLFGATGSTDAGFIQIFQASALESGQSPNRVHSFGLIGNFGPGGGVQLTKADTGVWRFTLGNYTEGIPAGSFTLKKNIYQFTAPKGKLGITQFAYNLATGRFGITYKLVPAEDNNVQGITASGMPIATSSIIKADMAFSIDAATTSGVDFQASDFARFVRIKAGSGKWKQR